MWPLAYVPPLPYGQLPAGEAPPGGNVLIVPGLTMGLGQLLGARIGSRMVVANGAKFIRPIFISMVLAITAKLLWDSYVK